MDTVINSTGMDEVFPRIVFVDGNNFKRLQSAHFNLTEFVGLINNLPNNRGDKPISVMTLAYLVELNKKLGEMVLGDSWYFNSVNLSEREQKYTEFAVWQDMTENECSIESASAESAELCYDALPVDGKTLIIVVQKGFLNHLASSKDNYKKFILTCIRCMDRFNCSSPQLNQLYLQLQMTGAPYELLRCRIQ